MRLPTLHLSFASATLAASIALVALCAAVALTAPGPELDNTAPAEALSRTAKAPEAASAPQATNVALAGYIARRWQVTTDTAHRVIRLAYWAAATHGLDPMLVLAVVARESSFQHNGNAGRLLTAVPDVDVDPKVAHGLMQVAGRHHPEKMPLDDDGRMRVTTESENLLIGSQILSEYLTRDRGDVRRALQRYNGNLADEESRFATYVLRVRAQLAKVVAEAATPA